MPAEKGSAFLLKVGDGGSAPVYSTVAGLRTLPVGETKIALLELPAFDGIEPGKPILAIFASGTGAGWRRAALSLQTSSGLEEMGSTAPRATMGLAVNALDPHTATLIDERSHLDVELFNSAMEIATRSGSPVDIDAPFFWVGGEFVRVGKIEQIAVKRYRLSRLIRGCFEQSLIGSGHASGEMVVLVEAQAGRPIAERLCTRGDSVQVEALGLGDYSPVQASTTVTALAISPLAPVHGTVSRLTDGSIALSWRRRSRIDLGWQDGVDQVLGEDREEYAVSLLAQGTIVAEWSVFEPRLLVSDAELSELNISPIAPLLFSVRQIGRFSQSGSLYVELI